jgi:hypothetical protein
VEIIPIDTSMYMVISITNPSNTPSLFLKWNPGIEVFDIIGTITNPSQTGQGTSSTSSISIAGQVLFLNFYLIYN